MKKCRTYDDFQEQASFKTKGLAFSKQVKLKFFLDVS